MIIDENTKQTDGGGGNLSVSDASWRCAVGEEGYGKVNQREEKLRRDWLDMRPAPGSAALLFSAGGAAPVRRCKHVSWKISA